MSKLTMPSNILNLNLDNRCHCVKNLIILDDKGCVGDLIRPFGITNIFEETFFIDNSRPDLAVGEL